MQSRPERLLLGGVTLWAGYRVASAEYSWYQRAGSSTDDPKYSTVKQEEGFWNKALFTYYLPEAVVATIVALPFTAPFRHQGAVMSGYHPILQSTAVGIYTAGFALEVLADYQNKGQSQSTSTDKDSIWSVLTNPKNLASTAVLSSFPLLLYSSDMLAPIELLGPLTYYLFHRYTYSSTTPESDVEAAKSAAKDVKEGRVDYKAEAEDAKDEAAKIIQNKSFLSVLAVGTLVGILEGFTHGSALRFGE
ncbi:uncharacterized protein HMPREF1541_01143 [Cyphellophora europaea CBS 101466]|uniref:Uncharacterized protein n=1 Tax=Cyphellophora europaea (strain CBS 101466) TaxID=1220924 RepID=W2SG32_CYPE1|nr:uncharacterized protein HMPREF1541_01143 [Cyphellophora europaea CBS 101466]ETN46953.1 hypothetical protein HMPREF1541_01143 [Cyphellophora europaea CBS 101466]